MADDHGHRRFEELALGHVLGGLPSRDASLFRAHLVECRECRRRVVELRDIADDLAATERDERRRAVVATRVADRENDDGPDRDGNADESRSWRARIPWSIVAISLTVVVVTGILFWNYHLRRVSGQYANILDRQERVLDVLAAGEPIEPATFEGVDGTAAVDDGTVAISLHDVPELTNGAVVVIWRVEEQTTTFVQGGRPPAEGPLPFIIDADGARALLITVEQSGQGAIEEPSERELARVPVSEGP